MAQFGVTTVETRRLPQKRLANDEDGRASVDSANIPVRRFTKAILVGLCVALVPYLWILWGGHLDPLRAYYPGNIFSTFYDTQARSLLNGSWNVPSGSLGIEGFVIHGRTYTYFGPFPALLRIPIFLYTTRLDGRLTAPSMLLAWIVTATFASLLLLAHPNLAAGQCRRTNGGGSVLRLPCRLHDVRHRPDLSRVSTVCIQRGLRLGRCANPRFHIRTPGSS